MGIDIADRGSSEGRSEPPLLAVRGLRIEVPGGKAVVQGIDLDVTRGQTTGLVGESGSGKSLTALAIARLLPKGVRIASGSIRLDGTAITTASPREMRDIRGARIGMVFQDPMTALNPVLTVGEQVAEAIRVRRRVGRAEVRARTEAAFEEVALPRASTLRRAYPHELSGGMRQRVLIAMALVAEPNLLIADEPTTALDVTVQATILDLLDTLAQRRGLGVLFITHDLALVAERAATVSVMRHGVIVESGRPEAIFAKPAHDYTRALLDAVPRLP